MREIVELVGQMAPYLLLGFALAGVLHGFVPTSIYRRFLGGSSFRSVLNAALVGIPLPLCSCGVIPTAMSLRKEGASRAATVSFLTATPQTGVDSIIATYSLLGLPFAVVRPVAALVTALLRGMMVCWFGGKDSGVGTSIPSVQPSRVEMSLGKKLKLSLRYACIDMMQDIGRTLFIGLVVAGAITVLLPDGFFSMFADNSLLSMLVVLVAAIPMYLCATGSIPIAVALMLKGLSPGAAFVLLMAGPAANAASVLVVGKVLGRRTLVIYILSIVLGAIGFGLAMDYLLPSGWFISSLSAIESCHEGSSLSWFEIGCSIVLIGLLVNAQILRYLSGRRGARRDSEVLCVVGLRCNKCRANAERAINSLPGVNSVSIDLQTGEVIIEGEATAEQIRGVVEPLGFKVEKR